MASGMETAGSRAAARFSVAGRTAIVTGAAAGIGRAAALHLAEAGVRVACADRDMEGAAATARAAGQAAAGSFAVSVDVADQASVAAMTARAIAELGQIDFLINNAGISLRHPAEAFPEQDWDRVIDVNLKGAFLCAQAAAAHMIPRGSGRIVNVASIGGMIAYANAIAYLSSKGGLIQLTRGLAVEWGKYGIGVNAVAPAIVKTPMLDKLAAENPARIDWFLSRMAMPELAQPEDIAAAIVFLCSPAARLITGHVLPVDGGYLAV